VYHAPKEKIPDVVMDPQKVREVIMNLADNAIKYTDQGKVEIFLEKNGNEVKYWVQDTGRGMTPDDIGKLFKKFSRVGSSRLVHTEGTGLGLYIAKQIIKKHNGKIWASSQGEGKGSTFALALKIKNPKLLELMKAQGDEKVAEDIAEGDENREDTIDMSKIKVTKKKS
jgi:signal transduction histidine kinase